MSTTPQQANARSAFEIAKGEQRILTLSESAVAGLLDPEQLMSALDSGFRALSQGRVATPDRPQITVPGKGFLLCMPSHVPGANIAVKMVSVFEGNLSRGLPNHLALICLFDPQTGAPVCIMDGTHITGVRTAAAAALSIRLLSREGSKAAVVVGAGVQAREHLKFLPLARHFDRVSVASLRLDDASRLADAFPGTHATGELEAAVRDADVVCLCTNSSAPVISAEWVKAGAHVTSVGYAPPGGELPPELAARNRLFVETRLALKPPPAGCSELAGIDAAAATELGDALDTTRPGRRSETEITVYKAMGIAMEDMVAANLAYERAKQAGVGGSMAW